MMENNERRRKRSFVFKESLTLSLLNLVGRLFKESKVFKSTQNVDENFQAIHCTEKFHISKYFQFGCMTWPSFLQGPSKAEAGQVVT